MERLGNAIEPAIAEVIGRAIIDQDYWMLEEAANALESAATALRQKEEALAEQTRFANEMRDNAIAAERELAELREPTEAMITAGYQAIGAKLYPAACKALWLAMYDKRPKAK